MTNINTFEEILQAMERNPALRNAMRRHILTEELLQLPAQVSRMETDVTELKADVTELKADVTELKADVTELKADVAGLKVDVAGLKEGQARLEEGQARLEEGQARLETDVADLKEGQARMSGQLGNIIGSDYERQAARLAGRRMRQQFGLSRIEMLQAITVPDKLELTNLLDRANETGAISQEEADDMELADLALRGLEPGGREVHVVAEVSLTVQDQDVQRAARRAAIMARADGGTVHPAVIGESISSTALEAASREQVLFIQLDSRRE
jgi:uncharacterized protein (UPF0335 family)